MDAVLSTLTSELQNLKAADAGSVGGVPSGAIGASGLFYQTFETPVDQWTKRIDDGTVTYPTNGKAGGKAFRADGGEVFYEFPEKIPYDPDRLYRIRTRVRMVTEPASAAESGINVGVHGYGADGQTLIDRDGGTDATKPHWYACAESNMNSRSEGVWYTFTGYFTGEGSGVATPSTNPDDPRAMQTGTRYIAPVFNLNETGGTGVAEIDYIALEVLTEAEESNFLLKEVVDIGNERVNDNRVVAASCNIPQLSDINPNFGIITAGIVTGTTVYLDLDATGFDPVMEVFDASGTDLIIGAYANGSIQIDGNFQMGTSLDDAGDVEWWLSGPFNIHGGNAIQIFDGGSITFVIGSSTFAADLFPRSTSAITGVSVHLDAGGDWVFANAPYVQYGSSNWLGFTGAGTASPALASWVQVDIDGTTYYLHGTTTQGSLGNISVGTVTASGALTVNAGGADITGTVSCDGLIINITDTLQFSSADSASTVSSIQSGQIEVNVDGQTRYIRLWT